LHTGDCFKLALALVAAARKPERKTSG